jgi:hypothetical protein
MDANDNATPLKSCGAFGFIASKLAPARGACLSQAIKSPTFIIGLELARQAGNSVNRNGICSVALILPLAFAQGVHFFVQSSPKLSLRKPGAMRVRATFLIIDPMNG